MQVLGFLLLGSQIVIWKAKVSRHNNYWHLKSLYLDSRPKRVGWKISSLCLGLTVAENTFCELRYKRDQAWFLGGIFLGSVYFIHKSVIPQPSLETLQLSPLVCLPRNGEQLRIICEDNKYDFRLQEIRDMKEILIIKPVRSSPGT